MPPFITAGAIPLVFFMPVIPIDPHGPAVLVNWITRPWIAVALTLPHGIVRRPVLALGGAALAVAAAAAVLLVLRSTVKTRRLRAQILRRGDG